MAGKTGKPAAKAEPTGEKKPVKVGIPVLKLDVNDPIPLLANHAVEKGDDRKKLRKDFCTSGDFEKKFDAEYQKFPRKLKKLSKDEIAFCEGWLILARLACWDASQSDNLDDNELVNYIKNQLSPPWPHTGTG